MTTKVLQFIGKGQITIPQEWRAIFNEKGNAVKATLKGSTIIIESFSLEEKTWNIEHIALNNLPKEDQKIVKQGRKAYKKGETEKFLAAPEFFKV